MIDTVIASRYRVERLLGEGATSRVYAAQDLRLGRSVAVKVLRDEFAGDAEFAERFVREARTAAPLSHPNIVNIFDVGREDSQAFIVMELVEGQPLRAYIETDAPFDVKDVTTVLDQLCDALDYAHAHGVIHRDLKPENVLLTEQGRVKIGDFGIARSLSAATLTAAGTVMGSARYISPEQAQGRPASAASDIYAAGVLAYEMLTGLPPFVADSPVAVALQHVEAAPLPPTRANPRLPAAMNAVLLKALSKDPRQRFATAMQLADAVAAAGQPVPAKVAVPPAPLNPTIAMPAVRPASGAAVAVAAEAGPALFRQAEAPRRRSSAWTALLVGVLGLAFVLLAFLAGVQALRSLPSLPSLAPPATPVRGNLANGPSGQSANALVGAGTSTPTPTTSPTAGPSGTPTATPTSGTETPTVVISPTVTDTPEVPTPTPPPTWTPGPPPPTATPAPPPGMVAVPAVVGTTEQAGQQAIKNAGLTSTFPNYQSQFTSQPPGYILSQQPAAGTFVPRGSTVYIAVRR